MNEREHLIVQGILARCLADAEDENARLQAESDSLRRELKALSKEISELRNQARAGEP